MSDSLSCVDVREDELGEQVNGGVYVGRAGVGKFKLRGGVAGHQPGYSLTRRSSGHSAGSPPFRCLCGQPTLNVPMPTPCCTEIGTAPICFMNTGTLAARHCAMIDCAHLMLNGRAPGPLSPPTTTHFSSPPFQLSSPAHSLFGSAARTSMCSSSGSADSHSGQP